MSAIQTKNTQINSFVSALTRGREAIEEAAKILVKMVDENPRIYDEIVKEHPHISYNLLANIERVGRGAMHAPLLWDGSPGARKLIAMPASQQKEIYENPVKVVRVHEGKKIVEEKRIQHLTPREARMVFDDNHVRTVEEQLKVVSQPSENRRAQPAQRYKVFGGELVVLERDTKFTLAQLLEIVEQMQAKATKTLQGDMKKGQIAKQD